MKIYEPYFQVEGHCYHTPDGMVLDSVTTIIKNECGLYQYGSATAATKGDHVHRACQFHDEGSLNETTVYDEIQPYLEQYKLALTAQGIVVKQNEVRRYSPKYLYAGCVDKVVEIENNLALIDIKTGATEHWHRWQTAAYAELLRLELGPLDRYILYLKPDSFRLAQHDNKRDFGEFLALLAANTIKINSGYRKRKEEDHNDE